MLRPICTALLLFIPSVAFASGGPPSPYFAPPTYIDIDHTVPEYTDDYYSLRALYWELVTPEESWELVTSNHNNNYATEPIPTQAQLDARKAAENQPDYKDYIAAADAFNRADYDTALTGFTKLRDKSQGLRERLAKWVDKSSNSWAVETATYMVARTQLVMSQKNWDGYTDPLEQVDQNLVKQASDSYAAYLKAYPSGLYADSARHIQRKILMLQGRTDDLSAALRTEANKAFAPGNAGKYDVVLLQEFMRFNTTPINAAQDAPLLITYGWLKEQIPTAEDISALNKRESDFREHPGLFHFTRALGLYKMKDYQGVLDSTPGDKVTNDLLSLSTELLRAKSFAALGNYDEALNVFTAMNQASSQEAIELEMAKLKIAQKNTLQLYEPTSHLKSENLLRAVAQNALDDKDIALALRKPNITGEKRAYLAQELALRYLLTRRYVDLTNLMTQEPAAARYFADIKQAVAILAKQPDDNKSKLDVARFEYYKNLRPNFTFMEQDYYTTHSLPEMRPWCGTACEGATARAKAAIPPYELFHEVAGATRDLPPDMIEAETLHFLVRCFRGSEFQNMCKWERDYPNESKAVYERLHKRYPASKWAKATPYYY